MLKLFRVRPFYQRIGGASLYPSVKRGLDVLFAIAALLLTAPLFFGIALGIRLTSPGPILFRQIRMGQGCEPFLLYKFRTMSCRAPHDCASAALVSPGDYLSRFGAFLRASSLDELPQLLNVLRGDMSLVGPRPVVLSENMLIAYRLPCGAYRVRPGISGLSQVLGRDLLGEREKAVLDGLYAERLSLGNDLAILLLTACCVLTRRGLHEGTLPRQE